VTESIKNLPISILQRLRNKAQAEGRNAQDLLRYYAIERFLYRLSQSRHAEQFVLKGALIFLAWGIDFPRPTRDIDLRGSALTDVETMCRVVQDICLTPVVADGMAYDANSVAGEVVREGARYQGIRIRFHGALGRARTSMHIDIGVADAITPPAQQVSYPTLLDMPAPQLRGYPPETVIAEKLEAMVVLDEINSRMKDFYDVWLIAQHFEFEGSLMKQAIHATFRQRRTDIPAGLPLALTDAFAVQKQEIWRAFITRHELDVVAPSDLQTVLEELRTFVTPLLSQNQFVGHWSDTRNWQ
jgi:predicted nucleotidyltransferase component of viral defense system